MIKPAIKDKEDKGRARNGMFMAFPMSLKDSVSDESPTFWRIQAAQLTCRNSTFLIINSYFPGDKDKNLDELHETLQCIKQTIDKVNFNHLLLFGDINVDFLRKSRQTYHVQQFLNDNNLIHSWNKYDVDFTYYQEIDGASRFATLDHFFWNINVDEFIEESGVLHVPDNLSDHCPIYCVVNCSFDSTVSKVIGNNFQPKPKWKLANSEEKLLFKNDLDTRLSKLQLPESMLCTDFTCKDQEHLDQADSFIVSILDAVENSAHAFVPTQNVCQAKAKKQKPGWAQSVAPYRDKAWFWNSVWKSAGKPLNCELFNIMKKTRNFYHYQIKKIKKSENTIRKNNLLNACLNGDKDIFTEIKKLRKHSPVIASSIDGVKRDIPEHFKGIYSSLYNSVNDRDELSLIQNRIQGKIDSYQLTEIKKVTKNVVKKAAEKLSDGKSDPVYSFSSDCIKNGPDMLYDRLSVAFQSFLVHGHFFIILAFGYTYPYN